MYEDGVRESTFVMHSSEKGIHFQLTVDVDLVRLLFAKSSFSFFLFGRRFGSGEHPTLVTVLLLVVFDLNTTSLSIGAVVYVSKDDLIWA